MKPVYFDSQIPEKIAKEEFCFPEGIMMENAASSLQNAITDFSKELKPCVLIVCGSGNNGGDGIALARRIFGKFEVYVFCVKNPKTPENRLSRHDRETIVALKRQGWNVTEIASRMKISEGEVELVLELGDIK